MKNFNLRNVSKKVMSFGMILSMAVFGMAVAKTNYIYAENGYNLYYGNLHAHTGYSDGNGTPDEAFKHMKESKTGDFGAITDHNGNLENHKDRWQTTLDLQDKYTDENFVAIAGTEVKLSSVTGEMNTFCITEVPYKIDAPNYYDWLCQHSGSIAQFNHPGAYENEFYGFDYWTEARNEHIKLFEYSNAGWDHRYLELFIQALDKGWKVAPSANSDEHDGDWLSGCDNRTVVLAKKLTREDIFDAIRNLRVYATEDKDLRVSYTVNGEVMGQTLYSPSSLQFNINVTSPSGNKIKKLELYADGKVVDSKSYSGTTADWSFTKTPDSKYYFVKVTMNDKKTALTAPIWIDKSGTQPVPTTSPITPVQPEGNNIALYKTATCSSVEDGTDLVASNVVDGSTSTRWASEEYGSNPEWVQIDLGSVKNINKVNIKWEDAYATAFKVQVSKDGVNYTTVADITNNGNTETEHSFNAEEGRYVRIYCTEKATKYGYSIYEVEVFESENIVEPQPTTQPTTTPTPTQTSTPAPTTTPKPTTTSTPVTTNNGWGEKVFAPYVQLSSGNVLNVNDVYNKT